MTATFQAVGLVAIGCGFLGTWMAGRRRTGWLVCIVSSALWLPALVAGQQWVAVLNCGLSAAICARNFAAVPTIAAVPTNIEESPRREPATVS